MTIKNTQFNGYILAGGKSSRMGVDKGLMLFKGKAIIEYVIEQIQPVVQKVVIISNNPEYKKFGVEVIPDLIKDIGPAGGIHTALQHTDNNLNFMLSCDMPFITKEAIQYIIKNAMQSQIALPVHKDKIEPLFGVYSKECSNTWFELISKGIIKLQDLVVSFNLKTIDVENHSLFNDSLFMNINTKKDFETAIKQT